MSIVIYFWNGLDQQQQKMPPICEILILISLKNVLQ